MVQFTVSEAKRQVSVVRILRSLSFFFFFFLFISLLLFVPITFHLFIIIIFFLSFLYAFLIMIFPLLVSGVRVGRLCYVGQEPAVLAAVWVMAVV